MPSNAVRCRVSPSEEKDASSSHRSAVPPAFSSSIQTAEFSTNQVNQSRMRSRWTRFWCRTRQLLAFILHIFPKAQEQAYFKHETKTRIKVVQFVSALHFAYLVLSFIPLALQTDNWNFRPGSGFGPLPSTAQGSTQFDLPLQLLHILILMTNLWQCIMPFIRPAHGFFVDHPWVHYICTWVWAL